MSPTGYMKSESDFIRLMKERGVATDIKFYRALGEVKKEVREITKDEVFEAFDQAWKALR